LLKNIVLFFPSAVQIRIGASGNYRYPIAIFLK